MGWTTTAAGAGATIAAKIKSIFIHWKINVESKYTCFSYILLSDEFQYTTSFFGLLTYNMKNVHHSIKRHDNRQRVYYTWI